MFQADKFQIEELENTGGAEEQSAHMLREIYYIWFSYLVQKIQKQLFYSGSFAKAAKAKKFNFETFPVAEAAVSFKILQKIYR